MKMTGKTPLASWYRATRQVELAARSLLLPRRGGGARALLLEGVPGAGKSAFAKALAEGIGAEYEEHLLHEWDDDSTLFEGVDVAAAVEGDGKNVRQPGVLARVAAASHGNRPVVLLLDELDKAPPRVEDLLLGWLQHGKVPLGGGRIATTDLDRVVVVATSNGTRPLGVALPRRFRRLYIPPLPADVVDAVVEAQTSASRGVARLVRKACSLAAEQDGAWASPQEIARACEEVTHICEDLQDVLHVLAAWGARGPEGRRWVYSPAGRRRAEAIWGEIVANRRGLA